MFLLRALKFSFGNETIVGVVRAANPMEAAKCLKLSLVGEDVGGSGGGQHYVYFRDYGRPKVAEGIDPRIAAHFEPTSQTQALYLIEVLVLGDEPELALQGRERSPEDFSA